MGARQPLAMSLAICVLTVLAAGHAVADDATKQVPAVVIRIALKNQAITPVTVWFIERALHQAESQKAQCLVIELDTPGGLLDSTREIVGQIIAARVPVVVYVAPAGARAASAGVFVTLSAHVAAMAPATNIGAAHPVQIGGLPIGPQPSSQPAPDSTPANEEPAKLEKNEKNSGGLGSTMEEKIVNDTVA